MSWFSTTAFHFELPGDAWQEHTTQLFRPHDDERTAFAITRLPAKEGEEADVVASIQSLPLGPYLEREIVRSERRQVGPLEAQDVSFVARSRNEAEYYRVVSVSYYDQELSFQWAGPAKARAAVDARAEETLERLRFRRR